jgi:hypothetical protein
MVCLSQAAICRYTTDRYEFDPAYGDLNLIVRHPLPLGRNFDADRFIV